MITEPFWKISQNFWSGKIAWTQNWPTECEIFSLGVITESRRSTILLFLQKLCTGIKTPKKHELIILGSALGSKSKADLLEKKIIELEKGNSIVEKLDAHYGFLRKKWFSLPRLYFLRTSTCCIHPALLKTSDKTVRDGLSKVCNIKFDNILTTQLAPTAAMANYGVFRIIISTSRLFGAAFGARNILTTIFLENFEDGCEKFLKSAWEKAELDEWTRKSSR